MNQTLLSLDCRAEACDDRQTPSRLVDEQTRQRLLKNCPYAFDFRSLIFQFEDGKLIVRGRVPTFYLKQMLQVWLQHLDGVRHINYQVDVISATGLSSELRNETEE